MSRPTEKDRRDCEGALKKLVDAREDGRLLVIHYKCDDFKAEPCRVTMIAVKDTDRGVDFAFPCVEDEERHLREFREFAIEHREHDWLCWNMRSQQFGFPHISDRMRRNDVEELPNLQRIDAALVCWQLYGDFDSGQHKKLLALSFSNDISTRDLLDWKTGKRASTNELRADAFRHVEIIYSLAFRMVDGTLNLPLKVGEPRTWQDKAREYLPRMLTALHNGEHVERLSYSSIARAVGVSPSTVKRHLDNPANVNDGLSMLFKLCKASEAQAVAKGRAARRPE